MGPMAKFGRGGGIMIVQKDLAMVFERKTLTNFIREKAAGRGTWGVPRHC